MEQETIDEMNKRREGSNKRAQAKTEAKAKRRGQRVDYKVKPPSSWYNVFPLIREGMGFKPEYDGPTTTWAIYVIDMGSPTKSGFLMERASAMWRMPSFCRTLEGAYTKRATPEEIIDLCLKKRESMNHRLLLIPVSVEEMKYVQEHHYPALPYDNPHRLKKTAKIKYFDED